MKKQLIALGLCALVSVSALPIKGEDSKAWKKTKGVVKVVTGVNHYLMTVGLGLGAIGGAIATGVMLPQKIGIPVAAAILVTAAVPVIMEYTSAVCTFDSGMEDFENARKMA
jgi:4-hydroxybenzoate polyprenyltransferase